MDPLDDLYDHDFRKFVLQEPNVVNFYYRKEPRIKFELDSSEKTKKDIKKEKDNKDKGKKNKDGKSEEEDLPRPFT